MSEIVNIRAFKHSNVPQPTAPAAPLRGRKGLCRSLGLPISALLSVWFPSERRTLWRETWGRSACLFYAPFLRPPAMTLKGFRRVVDEPFRRLALTAPDWQQLLP